MRQYLIEGVTGAFPFIVDRSKAPVSESRPTGESYTRIPGRFSVCDCINGNNRRYSRSVWEKNLQTGSILQESITRNAAFGLLEHPKDGIVTLLSPISHHVTKAEMIESKDSRGNPVFEVVGEIALLDTEEGKKLKALIEGGYNPLVSSRGYGSLEKAPDGVDEVKEDYVCEGWDVVIKPSFENAELTPNRSTTNAQMAAPVAPNPQAESKAATVPVESKAAEKTTPAPIINLKESSPSTTGTAKPASETKTNTKTMELNEIKLRLDALRNTDPAKPLRFAESMTTVEELKRIDPYNRGISQKYLVGIKAVTNCSGCGPGVCPDPAPGDPAGTRLDWDFARGTQYKTWAGGRADRGPGDAVGRAHREGQPSVV